MKVEIDPDLQIAWLMADHQRLGTDACGRWRQHTDPSFSFADILKFILDQTVGFNTIVRPCEKGACFAFGDGYLHGQCYATVDAHGNIVTIDRRRNSVLTFRGIDGALIREFGSEGDGIGQLNTPRGLAADGQGNIYVGDCDNHRVQVFNPKGEVAMILSGGPDTARLKFPCGVAVDDINNRIYVADCDNDRLVVFEKDGLFVGTVGKRGHGKGEFIHPVGVCVDPKGRIVVADGDNNRVQVLRLSTAASKWERLLRSVPERAAADADAQCEHQLPVVVDAIMGSRGSDNGQLRFPCGVACNAGGDIVVADALNHRVSVFSAEGHFLRTFGSRGGGVGELRCPYSVAVDGDGSLVVGDGGNKRVVVFGLALRDALQPEPTITRRPLALSTLWSGPG